MKKLLILILFSLVLFTAAVYADGYCCRCRDLVSGELAAYVWIPGTIIDCSSYCSGLGAAFGEGYYPCAGVGDGYCGAPFTLPSTLQEPTCCGGYAGKTCIYGSCEPDSIPTRYYHEQLGYCTGGSLANKGIPGSMLVEMEDGSFKTVASLVPGDNVKSFDQKGDFEIITIVDIPLPEIRDVCVVSYKIDDTPTYGNVLMGMDTFLNTQITPESNIGVWKKITGTYPLAIGDKVRGKDDIWYDVVNINCFTTEETYDILFSSGFPTFFIVDPANPGNPPIAVMGDEGEGEPPPPPETPEFSTIGVLLALLAVTIGMGFLVFKKK